MPAKEDPPLVSLKVTNPVTYLKIWWKKVMDNEGVSFSFRIRPLTAIFLTATTTLILTGAGYTLGRISLPWPEPIVKYIPKIIPTPTPQLWKDTAFSGSLKYTSITQKYYLVTTSAEAITLDVPNNIDLSVLVGKRILASGEYNKSLRLLVVKDAQNMEVLPLKPTVVPTSVPSPTPTSSLDESMIDGMNVNE